MELRSILTIFLIFLLFACKKDPVDETPNFSKDRITGNSQKGPFLNGSSLTLFELDANYSQTGNSFNSQILDNSGAFELSDIALASNYVKLRADGFFFNEVSNANSQAPITLNALSDISDKSTVNINLLTSLEVSRMEYLLGSGLTFSGAKIQAQGEVLNIFSLTPPSIVESELLDISQAGDGNAVLLAVSIIIEGFRNEAELTQLLGDISTDIRTDGILNSQSLGALLVNDVRLMDLAAVRSHIESKYASLGVEAEIPAFEPYIQQFLDSTTYTFNNTITYPNLVNGIGNLIADTTFTVNSVTPYSVAAHLPNGSALKVVVRPTPGYSMSGVGTVFMTNNGWTVAGYSPDSIVYNALGYDQIVRVSMAFGPPTSTDLYIYENHSAVPTRTRTILNQ